MSRFSGTCEWQDCTNACTRRWCDEHRADGYKQQQRQNHQRRKQDPGWAARNRETNRRYMRSVRSTWTDDDRKAADQQRRLSKYGVTAEWYVAQLERQAGRCAICDEMPGGKRPWHIDHCHETGAVRSLLCHFCNVGIGNFRDDPVKLRAATAYVERHRLRSVS